MPIGCCASFATLDDALAPLYLSTIYPHSAELAAKPFSPLSPPELGDFFRFSPPELGAGGQFGKIFEGGM